MVPFRSGVICRYGGGRAQFKVWNADGRGAVAVLGGTVDLEDQQVLTQRIAFMRLSFPACSDAAEQTASEMGVTLGQRQQLTWNLNV